MDEIRLSYGRIGELYSGNIWLTPAPTRGMLLQADFESISFPRMMSRLAEVIREHDPVQVVITRVEVKGSYYKLDQQTVELLRTDPAAAISSMMPEARTVVVRDHSAFATPPNGLLRVGHDTIAEAFGDLVYCAVDPASHQIECPGCGRWAEASTQRLACEITGCSIRIMGKLTGRAWFVVGTDELLKLGLERYYLPRSWNSSRGWISRDELLAMFENFKKERAQCSQTDSRE